MHLVLLVQNGIIFLIVTLSFLLFSELPDTISKFPSAFTSENDI